MADAEDAKSSVGNHVRVQVPLSATTVLLGQGSQDTRQFVRGCFVPSGGHLEGWQGRRLADNLDSVSLDESRKIRRAVIIADLFERLRHSPALTVPNTQYCSWCHRHNLRSVGEGVNNGRTNRDSFSPAVSGEAFVNLERLMEIGRYHFG